MKLSALLSYRILPLLTLGFMTVTCSETQTVSQTHDDGWRLVWSDEFDTPKVDDSKWATEVRNAGWINNEKQAYTDRPENVRTENGSLVLEGRRDFFNGSEYSSGRVRTEFKSRWLEGRIEARIKLPGGLGTWPAFFLLPDDQSLGWPAMGEFDIVENVGFEPNIALAAHHSATVHFTGTRFVPGAYDDYHVYAAEWYPDRIDVFVDGEKYFTTHNQYTGNDQWPFHKKFHLVLAFAIGGNWGGQKGIDPNIWPRQMLVDYVRVFQK